MLPAANSPRKPALQACTEGHSKRDLKKKIKVCSFENASW